ncbi:MerR family transcriptional regulator [Sporosarcina sp. Sa2YVA2]|uniref:MerR family transcriptional regulator n=1 Tax=Sporosarcina quadrami TaxID=2762234 RepID=A0ABR8U7X7_9BACL|nr:MerR family transcriptional regulator [Sporosarcina quadrami]MBD7984144.1 MerR family transcriptional regulator [Sporosarcina quadrami]
MYSIGKVAAMSNVTVRTLRYYDEIGLLPAEKNAQGHRFYSDIDISKLHYILTLRDIGLPLESIQKALTGREVNVHDVLEMRLKMIQSEMKQLKKMEASITSLMVLAEVEQSTDWESVFATFYTFPNNRDALKSLWGHHFSEEEIETLLDLPHLGGGGELTDTTVDLLKDVRANLHMDPASETAQQLAKRWVTWVEDMYEGNSELSNKVWKTSQHEEAVGFYQFEKELVAFIEQAITYYYESQLKDNMP